MNRYLFYITLLLLATGCSLNSLEPAQTQAFMKFYGEDGNTRARDLARLADGYLLLGVNTGRDGSTSTLLIKTDLLGNRQWAVQFPNIDGKALTVTANGYFIVGDSINSNNLAVAMALIKTDTEGNNRQYASLSGLRGSAILAATSGEIIVSGYQNAGDSIFLTGYSTDLTLIWGPQKWGTANTQRVTFNNMLESSTGDVIWATGNQEAGNNYSISAMVTPADNTQHRGQLDDLFPGMTVLSQTGGLAKAPIGAMITQTIRLAETGKTAIALAMFSTDGSIAPVGDPLVFDETGNDVFGSAAITASDGSIVVLGYTDKRVDGNAARTDYDLYIRKTGTAGFTRIIGGTGNETGSALVQAEDGGLVVLATMTNTNDVDLMMLVKLTREGKLTNE